MYMLISYISVREGIAFYKNHVLSHQFQGSS